MSKKEGTATAMTKENLEAVENKFDKTKEKVSENLSNVAGKIHEKSDNAQHYLDEKIENVEDFMRKKTYEAGELTHQTIAKANKLGHRAGDVLEHSSEYIKNFDVREAKDSVKRTLRENPEVSIAVAGVFGLLLGLIIGRKRNN